jgi:hypothetical protein
MNTREYQWSEIQVRIGGRDIVGLRSVKYTETQEKEVLYAKGSKPRSIQRGNISIEGEISLTQSEYEALRAASPTGTILDLNVNVLVSYGNPATGTAMINDELIGVEFTEAPMEMTQGDKFMEITLPFIALQVRKVQ